MYPQNPPSQTVLNKCSNLELDPILLADKVNPLLAPPFRFGPVVPSKRYKME